MHSTLLLRVKDNVSKESTVLRKNCTSGHQNYIRLYKYDAILVLVLIRFDVSEQTTRRITNVNSFFAVYKNKKKKTRIASFPLTDMCAEIKTRIDSLAFVNMPSKRLTVVEWLSKYFAANIWLANE